MKKIFLLLASVAVAGSAAQAQHSIDNPFFDRVDFRGAFNATDDWTIGWAEFDPQNKVYPATTMDLGNSNTTSGAAYEISSDMTLDKNQVYLLKGWVYITNSGKLTIPAGTIIRGDQATQGAIIVEPGGQLIANGTQAEPIVFTSNQSVGSRNAGDWGGLIITGNAPTNRNTPQVEGGPRTTYGGTNASDNSGTLKYVRVEFPGIAFQPNKEINGITFGGVGSQTVVDYVQVSFSGDDSYEWFGGTVNAKHLIAYKSVDDEFDADFGWRGMVQYAVSLRDPNIADVSGSNGFESDNYDPGINPADSTTDMPFTHPIFSNVSLYGVRATGSTTYDPNHKRGAHLRRNTRLNLYNSVIAGYPVGLIIEGPSVDKARSGQLKIMNTVLAGNKDNFAVAAGDAAKNWDLAAEEAWFRTAAFENEVFSENSALMVEDPFKQSGKPNFLLKSGSALDTGSVWYVGGSIGIGSKENVSSFSVYPNPVKQTLYFDQKIKVRAITITDMNGRVYMQTAPNSNAINVSSLPSGLYIVMVTDFNNEVSRQQIIKQ